MENQFFLNPQMWQPLSTSSTSDKSSLSAIDVEAIMNNCPSSKETQDCFFKWDKSNDQNLQFDSALSSMVSSPAASNSNMSSDNFVIRELIGKLGNIGNNDEILTHSQSQSFAATSYGNNTNNNSTNTSCYSTPLSSPPKVNINHLGKPMMPLNSSTMAEFLADPGFAERAAKFSCFGSRSFNGRKTQLGLNNNAELAQRSNLLMENGKLSRVSSTPSLKVLGIGSQMGFQESNNSPMEIATSQEESTISEQTLNRDNGVIKPSSYVNSRKRKCSSKGKANESSTLINHAMGLSLHGGEDSNVKRYKANDGNENNGTLKEEKESKEDASNGVDEKQNKSKSKPPEPPKDYIHVRARRGQATDSHSLAERVRREKISERMKLLQDLVPGCNKVTGKALMLDEIINYVQSLQRQVEFLSMKLSTVNTSLDFNIQSLISKDVYESNDSLEHTIFPQDSSTQGFYGQQQPQNSAIYNNIPNGTLSHSSMDPLDTTTMCQNIAMHLPSLNGFNEGSSNSQCPIAFSEEDLQTIVQMGFGQISNRKSPQSQSFNGSNQVHQ